MDLKTLAAIDALLHKQGDSMKLRRRSNPRTRNEWPIVVYFWAAGQALLSYAVARVLLDGQPHPIHWLAGVLGGLLGIPLGWLWFHWRGDMF